jgi:hypothetical protein
MLVVSESNRTKIVGMALWVISWLTLEGRRLWGRILEGWPNTAARLAGWRRVTREVCFLYVMDGPCHLPWRTEPLAPRSGADLLLDVLKTPSRATWRKEGMAWYSSRPMPSLSGYMGTLWPHNPDSLTVTLVQSTSWWAYSRDIDHIPSETPTRTHGIC